MNIKILELIKKFRKNIIYIGVICLLIILIVVVKIFLFGNSKSISLSGDYDIQYDIQRDYCGKVIDIHYCQCAFEGEFCEVIGTSDKEAVNRLVITSFEKWVTEQKKK